MSFIPLHVYSQYSFLRSGFKLENYIKESTKLGYKNIGLCDFETLTGAPLFVDLCYAQGKKAIVGEDIEIEGLVFSFFVMSEIGYRSLVNLGNKKKLSGVTLSDIKDNANGLIIVLDIMQDILIEKSGDRDFGKYISSFTDGLPYFYFGINDDGSNKNYVEDFREFASSHSYKVIAFPFIKYAKKEDAIILRMCEAIKNDETLEENELKGPNYLLNVTEVEHLYTEEEINNTEELASYINFDISSKRGKMINFTNDLGLSSPDYLKKLAYDNLIKLNIADTAHQERLKMELDVIISMGFADYFLIVQDYVNWARNHNIPVGPGRGSAAGSLVSYVLGITMVDPLEYDLLFERFLNKERQTMPDIDVDFSDIKREWVVSYLRKKYGNDHVSNILTCQTILARQALRDTGRIFKYPQRDIDLLTKLIPTHHSKNITLRETYKTVKAFRDLVDNDAYYLKIVSLASKIEGFIRQAGMHAAGVVLNAEPLDKVIPVSIDSDGKYIEEYEMSYLEKQGFLKMDILALRNLTIVEECLEKLKARGVNLKMDDIPYKDEAAIKVIKDGNTTGIFQLESSGMRNAIQILEPEKFEDVVALLALFRPGPMQEIKTYANRKKGIEKITYPSKDLVKILEPTYGIIVYQEQIMQIASVFAGFSLSQADIFRRAISKKDASKLSSLKNSFILGAMEKGHSRQVADEVFELIAKFADYGFNKSHALSYAVFSTRMAYLKANYPEEFYSSILDNTGGESDSFVLAINEVKNAGIEVTTPNVNLSTNEFVINEGKLVFPLNRIKGLFNEQANNIILEREIKGPFTDYYDFVLRMKQYKLGAPMLMKLINAGALDCLDPSRASLRINMPNAINYTNLLSDEDGVAIIDMSSFAKPIYNHVEDDYIENLNLENETLGLMISGSPLDIYKDEIAKMNITKIQDAIKTSKTVTIVGIIKTIKTIKTKNGQPMAFISLYDDTMEIESTIFSTLYEEYSQLLKRNSAIIIEGYYQKERGGFVAKTLSSFKKENK